MKRFWLLTSIALLFLLLFGACQVKSPAQTKNEKPVIFVSIVPQKYFVERIAGDTVNVVVMVEPGAEPHTYEPKPAQMQMLSDTDLYFSIDAPFEVNWLSRIADINPNLKVVNTAEGIVKRLSTEHHHEGEEETEAEHEEEGELDPHIWLSPRLVAQQCKIISDTLAAQYPENAQAYAENLNAFLADIEALDQTLKADFAKTTNKTFMVYHPAWGYFADEYGLTEIAVEIGGTEPSALELAELIEHARTENIHVIFAQPEFSTRSAEALAEEIDGEVVLISDLEEDWLANMQKAGEAFLKGLE
jgi:zinc transport system substrate-binding protein